MTSAQQSVTPTLAMGEEHEAAVYNAKVGFSISFCHVVWTARYLVPLLWSVCSAPLIYFYVCIRSCLHLGRVCQPQSLSESDQNMFSGHLDGRSGKYSTQTVSQHIRTRSVLTYFSLWLLTAHQEAPFKTPTQIRSCIAMD